MLSSQSPVIVRRDGRNVFVTGSPGGRTIPNTVLCVLIDKLEFGLDVGAAVDGPRLHHAWFPDVVRLEPRAVKLQPLLVEKLTALGHHVKVGKSRKVTHIRSKFEMVFSAARADDRRTEGEGRGILTSTPLGTHRHTVSRLAGGTRAIASRSIEPCIFIGSYLFWRCSCFPRPWRMPATGANSRASAYRRLCGNARPSLVEQRPQHQMESAAPRGWK